MTIRGFLAALGMTLAAVSAYATDPFIARLGKSEELLKKGDYEKALKIDNRLIDDMVDNLGPGDEETKWFAVALLHKAFALRGVGQDNEAIWFWHMALNIRPRLAEADMSTFGAPAEFLKQYPLVPADLPHADSKRPNVQAPKTLKRVEPVYPYAVRWFHVSGIVILECVIDKNGDIRDVTVKKALPAGTILYTAMQALRQWKFAPATMDGKPVEVLFNLTFNYKLYK